MHHRLLFSRRGCVNSDEVLDERNVIYLYVFQCFNSLLLGGEQILSITIEYWITYLNVDMWYSNYLLVDAGLDGLV